MQHQQNLEMPDDIDIKIEFAPHYKSFVFGPDSCVYIHCIMGHGAAYCGIRQRQQ